jgi:hypothetical protein
VKKVHFSPVASLLMSLSLALGILVGDVGGFKFVASAHAQANDTCGGAGVGTIAGSPVLIANGIASGGIAVRDVLVNGELVAAGTIAGSVTIVGGDVAEANGVFVGGIGVDDPSQAGVYVGGAPCTSGVYVGGDTGGTEVSLGGAALSSSGTAVGGTLTGDNITVTNGVITGQNLLLSGTVIGGGFTSGTFTSVQVTPVN